MGHGTWVLWCCVVRCALYQYICISLYFFCCRTLFFHRVLCSSRLDLEYTCTLNRVVFILSMSNRWEQELQQCLEADVDFDVGDFIVQHPQIAPQTIHRRHASMRQTLMKRLNKRAKRGLQSSSMASLNTAQAQAARVQGTPHKHKLPRVQGTPLRHKLPRVQGTPLRHKLPRVQGTPLRHKLPRVQGTPLRHKLPRVLLEVQGTRRKRKPPRVQGTRRKRKPPRVQGTRRKRKPPRVQGTRQSRNATRALSVDTPIHRRDNMPKLHILNRGGSLVPLRKSFSAGNTSRHRTFL